MHVSSSGVIPVRGDMERKLIQEHYWRDGFFFPLRAISPDEAADCRGRFESLEDGIKARKIARSGQFNEMHHLLPFVNKLARNERILDAVEAVIGANILLWGSTFFIKEPRSKGYISWHQDLRYWGLKDSDAMVSAWLALGPVKKANGCMQFVKGSHTNGLIEHVDRFEADNFLYRGQEAQVEIAPSDVFDVELEPGEFSLHHGFTLHSSPANPSETRRWGLTINYIAPHNRQLVAKEDFATLVRGEDAFGHFLSTPAPEFDLSEQALEWHARVITARDQASFEGV